MCFKTKKQCSSISFSPVKLLCIWYLRVHDINDSHHQSTVPSLPCNTICKGNKHLISIYSPALCVSFNLPSNYVLFPSGTYCNSASACFVASDGKNLRLYQAVVDARKLLDELSDPETSVSGLTHERQHINEM